MTSEGNIVLSDRHKKVITSMVRILNSGRKAYPKDIQKECVSSAKLSPEESVDRMAPSTLYKKLNELVDSRLVWELDESVLGRKTPKHYYEPNAERLRALGHGDLVAGLKPRPDSAAAHGLEPVNRL